MGKKKLKKRIILLLVAAAVLAGGGWGGWSYLQYRNDQKTVEVMPVSYLSTGYWGDESSSMGTVLSDYVQELYPEAGKIITQIFVTEGQEVKIGDPLLQYDKTKLELDVESKELAVKQADLRIDEAQKQLKKLQNTKPVSTPKPGSNGGGSTVIVQPTPRPTPTPTPAPTPTPVPTIPPADVTVYDHLDLSARPYKGEGTTEDPYVFLCTDGCTMSRRFLGWLLDVELNLDEDDPEYWEEAPEVDLATPFAAVFEVREGNSNYGDVVSTFLLDGTQWRGGISTREPVRIDSFLESPVTELFATPTPSPTPSANNYDDMGYTSTKLAELIAQKKEEIRDLQFNLKQAQLNLEIAQHALENSTVTSNLDGRVRSLLELDAAVAESKPFLVVSGAEKYYISGVLGEGLLGSVRVGDTVTAMSWMTGASYQAEIVAISDYPLDSSSGNYYYGGGNPNSSAYEFTAIIQGDDSTLQNGMNVDITMSVQDQGDSQGLYLEKPYLREDDGGFYVMKAGLDNRLCKQYVQTGKAIYGGGYLEIKSGLTAEDFIAFPYGPDTKEGVRALLQDSEEPPYPEGSDSAPSGLDPDGLLPSLEEGAARGKGAAQGTGTAGSLGEEPGAMAPNLPDGAVITGRDENGTYFETENGGGVLLD